MKNKLPAVCAILATTLFWGGSYSSTKVLLSSLRPEQIAFCRLVISCLIFSFLFLYTNKIGIAKKDLLRVIAGGLFGNFFYFLLENNGLLFTTASMGSLIIATIPVLDAVAGAIIFREKNSTTRWLGVLLSFLGVYLIIRTGSNGKLSLTNLKGNLLVFGAACTWVIYTRINEPLITLYDSITINLYQVAVGMISLSPLALPLKNSKIILQNTVALNLLYLGICCSAIAYFLYLYALKVLGTTAVTSFLNLVPVFGVLGGALILQETLTTIQLVGAAIVICGVSLVTMAAKTSLAAPSGSTPESVAIKGD
ncbi:MAG: DMT family transporter [Firmicutes bacterium]|nr:DMT family transporter [Bacillota bacterium]